MPENVFARDYGSEHSVLTLSPVEVDVLHYASVEDCYA